METLLGEEGLASQGAVLGFGLGEEWWVVRREEKIRVGNGGLELQLELERKSWVRVLKEKEERERLSDGDDEVRGSSDSLPVLLQKAIS